MRLVCFFPPLSDFPTSPKRTTPLVFLGLCICFSASSSWTSGCALGEGCEKSLSWCHVEVGPAEPGTGPTRTPSPNKTPSPGSKTSEWSSLTDVRCLLRLEGGIVGTRMPEKLAFIGWPGDDVGTFSPGPRWNSVWSTAFVLHCSDFVNPRITHLKKGGLMGLWKTLLESRTIQYLQSNFTYGYIQYLYMLIYKRYTSYIKC